VTVRKPAYPFVHGGSRKTAIALNPEEWLLRVLCEYLSVGKSTKLLRCHGAESNGRAHFPN